jgi:hypothetical protein
MSSKTSEKDGALIVLMEQLNVASEYIILDVAATEIAKRQVRGREPGYYSRLASGKMLTPTSSPKSSRKGNKGNKKGGAKKACDRNIVSLAIDSAIIMAGAAALSGASYVGFGALISFMQIYGLDEAIQSAIQILYESLKNALISSLNAGRSVGSGLAGAISSIFAATLSSASSAFTHSRPILTSLVTLTPPVLFGRYFKTGLNAQTEAIALLNSLKKQHTSIKEYTGALTRSLAAKKEALEAKIAEINSSISSAATPVSSAATHVSEYYRHLKAGICLVIDSGADVAGILSGYNDVFGGLENMTVPMEGGKRNTRKLIVNKRRSTGRKAVY